MESVIATILGAVIFVSGQFGLLWYKIGKVEQKVTDICLEVHNMNGNKEKH